LQSEREKHISKVTGKMKLRYKILLAILVILSFALTLDSIRLNRQQRPLFVVHANTYKDGGTKTYYGLGYKAIHWNKLSVRKTGSAELEGIYKGWEISYFPVFKNISDGPSDKIGFLPDPLCQATAGSVNHFANQLIAITKQTMNDYDQKGFGGGVDGFSLIKYFKFLPEDFTGVHAQGGDYSVLKGVLLYSGHAASDSPVLTMEGMKTLLENTGRRLKMECHSIESIDKLITVLK
jgi:hypothetical protein